MVCVAVEKDLLKRQFLFCLFMDHHRLQKKVFTFLWEKFSLVEFGWEKFSLAEIKQFSLTEIRRKKFSLAKIMWEKFSLAELISWEKL